VVFESSRTLCVCFGRWQEGRRHTVTYIEAFARQSDCLGEPCAGFSPYMTQSHGSRVYTYMVREDSRAVKGTTSLVILGDEETEGRVWLDVRIYPLLDNRE